MNEHFRNHVAKEKTAFKTSGPWFLAGLAVSFAGHKHGKAGGEDHGYMY